jgi:putative FmdB family regulatory protein
MPIYEYACPACGHTFDVIQKATDPPVTLCPKCGGKKVKKRMSSPAIQFKGSGFYITDYTTKSGQPAKGEPSAKAESGAKGDAGAKPKAEKKKKKKKKDAGA